MIASNGRMAVVVVVSRWLKLALGYRCRHAAHNVQAAASEGYTEPTSQSSPTSQPCNGPSSTWSLFFTAVHTRARYHGAMGCAQYWNEKRKVVLIKFASQHCYFLLAWRTQAPASLQFAILALLAMRTVYREARESLRCLLTLFQGCIRRAPLGELTGKTIQFMQSAPASRSPQT